MRRGGGAPLSPFFPGALGFAFAAAAAAAIVAYPECVRFSGWFHPAGHPGTNVSSGEKRGTPQVSVAKRPRVARHSRAFRASMRSAPLLATLAFFAAAAADIIINSTSGACRWAGRWFAGCNPFVDGHGGPAVGG
jgi:hypothetical protein